LNEILLKTQSSMQGVDAKKTSPANSLTTQQIVHVFSQPGLATTILPVLLVFPRRARSPQKWPKLSAIDVTVKKFFERLYLISGLTPIDALCDCTLGTHTPTAHSRTISRFLCKFFPEWPIKCFYNTIHQIIWPSPCTLSASHSEKLVISICEPFFVCRVLKCFVTVFWVCPMENINCSFLHLPAILHWGERYFVQEDS